MDPRGDALLNGRRSYVHLLAGKAKPYERSSASVFAREAGGAPHAVHRPYRTLELGARGVAVPVAPKNEVSDVVRNFPLTPPPEEESGWAKAGKRLGDLATVGIAAAAGAAAHKYLSGAPPVPPGGPPTTIWEAPDSSYLDHAIDVAADTGSRLNSMVGTLNELSASLAPKPVASAGTQTSPSGSDVGVQAQPTVAHGGTQTPGPPAVGHAAVQTEPLPGPMQVDPPPGIDMGTQTAPTPLPGPMLVDPFPGVDVGTQTRLDQRTVLVPPLMRNATHTGPTSSRPVNPRPGKRARFVSPSVAPVSPDGTVTYPSPGPSPSPSPPVKYPSPGPASTETAPPPRNVWADWENYRFQSHPPGLPGTTPSPHPSNVVVPPPGPPPPQPIVVARRVPNPHHLRIDTSRPANINYDRRVSHARAKLARNKDWKELNTVSEGHRFAHGDPFA